MGRSYISVRNYYIIMFVLDNFQRSKIKSTYSDLELLKFRLMTGGIFSMIYSLIANYFVLS